MFPVFFKFGKKVIKIEKKILKLEPKNFTFVKQNQNPHIAFCRVGSQAGKFSLNWADKSLQTHYFIQFKTIKIFKTTKNFFSDFLISIVIARIVWVFLCNRGVAIYFLND